MLPMLVALEEAFGALPFGLVDGVVVVVLLLLLVLWWWWWLLLQCRW